MPVTIRTCGIQPTAWPVNSQLTVDPKALLRCASEEDAARWKTMIACAASDTRDPEGFVPYANGLVGAAVHAWNTHKNLVLRPDDFWICIICQLSFYINEHAEELRGNFVTHKGTKKLEIQQEGTIYSCNYATFANLMKDKIGENVNDPTLVDWIIPDFSTTTQEDKTIAAVVFMGAMQKYFEYYFDCATCGIPNITLLGKKQDWISLQRRVDKMLQWGREAEMYHRLLTPILRHMVLSFDDPTSEAVTSFWAKIVSKTRPNMMSGGRGPYTTGWLSGIFLWEANGKMREGMRKEVCFPKPGKRPTIDEHSELCRVDDVYYPRLYLDYVVVPSVASVPVTVRDLTAGITLKTLMVAGCAGYKPCLVDFSGAEPTKPASQSAEKGARDKENGMRALRTWLCCLKRSPRASSWKTLVSQESNITEPEVPRESSIELGDQTTAVHTAASRMDKASTEVETMTDGEVRGLTCVKPVHYWWIFEVKE
ncbi:hypothetical protein jhhlp_004799 [Lomentospora prolificans]|uniref:Uncharacterized protein n=1 Tax=Lomentospora prolificans TaxID=41688 RepID=A0A2N3N8H4_9PEZI|nr:hypothetical protein jhhlp_004799 [Lomentospora prolificans]